MNKLNVTILHKLPNRIRFKISHRIKNLENFSKMVKSTNKSVYLRYNSIINTVLVKFDQEEVYLQEIIYRVITGISIENNMSPVKLIEDYYENSINSLSMYSGGAILLAFLYSLGGRKLKNLQTGMNNSALILTTAAIIEHAYSDTKRKGFFDIEILPAIYLLKSYFNNKSVITIILMWLTTFGRHLIIRNHSDKIVRIYRLKDENNKCHYIANIQDDNSIENLNDLIYHIFFYNKISNDMNDRYITLQ